MAYSIDFDHFINCWYFSTDWYIILLLSGVQTTHRGNNMIKKCQALKRAELIKAFTKAIDKGHYQKAKIISLLIDDARYKLTADFLIEVKVDLIETKALIDKLSFMQKVAEKIIA